MNIDALLSRMTLRQKLAQMTQLDYTFLPPRKGGEITARFIGWVSGRKMSTAAVPYSNITGAALTRRVQEEHLKKSSTGFLFCLCGMLFTVSARSFPSRWHSAAPGIPR